MMPADPESTGWIAGALTAMGFGGGVPLLRMFAKQSDHGARITRLEDDQKAHGVKIDKTHTTVTELKIISKRMEADVASILGLIRGRD